MNSIVVDCGATNLRVGLSTDGHQVKRFFKYPTPTTWPRTLTMLRQSISDLAVPGRIRRVIVGLPALLDPKHETVLGIPSRRSWIGRPIRRDLEHLFRAPVRLENDAALGALGEALAGAGRGYHVVAYIAVGTGIGGACVVNGRLGTVRFGYEPGHHLLDAGQTFETLVGGRALQRRFGTDWKKVTAADWKWVARQLAVGLVNVVDFWSPDIIVLGGSVALKGKIPLRYLRRQVAKRLVVIPRSPRIVKAKLGDQAGLYGALTLLR